MSIKSRFSATTNKKCQTNPNPAAESGSCRLAVPHRPTGDELTADSAPLPRLTPEQQDLVARHRGLVGVHLRTRVPTPRQPMRHREYDDLFQHGCVALARAAARYRPQRDGVFAAYALPRIRAAIHRALYDLFTVVHVPVRAIQEARRRGESTSRRPPLNVQEMTDDIERRMIFSPTDDGQADSLRHAMHHRFEVAVRRALEQLRARAWRYRDPTAIMTRIAHERLLLDDERLRTPLRRIAREANVSSGRACDYEKQLVKTVAANFQRDPQVRALVSMAGEDGAGWDAPLDASGRERLARVEVDEFESRFTQMDPPARAQAIYSLIERSTNCMPEVARNLFRLTLSLDDDAIRTVA